MSKYFNKEALIKIMRNVYCEGCELCLCKDCMIEQIIDAVDHPGGEEAEQNV